VVEKLAEPQIGAGDNPLAPEDLHEPPDALRDRLGMLDEVRGHG
jgi:MoxR-like ATPase